MSGIVMLYPATRESLEVPIETSADPTPTAPEFSFGTHYAPGSWVVGAWSGPYSGGSTLAITPTMGGLGAGLTIAAAHSYTLWVKVTVGTEVAEWPVGTVTCP